MRIRRSFVPLIAGLSGSKILRPASLDSESKFSICLKLRKFGVLIPRGKTRSRRQESWRPKGALPLWRSLCTLLPRKRGEVSFPHPIWERGSRLLFKVLANVIAYFAIIWSAHTEGETPVPIPNTAVKPLRADGSVLVRVCESRSVLLKLRPLF